MSISSFPQGDGLASIFGALELRVLEALWQQHGDVTVRDLCTHFPSAAYTTLMTTLDRLYRKGFLNRVKVGRAFAYRPRYTREELASGIAASALTSLLKEHSVRPVLSFNSKTGAWCRQFEVRHANRQVSHALACRGEDGRWNVIASTAPGAGGITPAGADRRKTIDDLAASMMRGEPLSQADEAHAIGKGWRQP